jgi:circadian clock protein KaiC
MSFDPNVVVIDSVTNLISSGTIMDVKSMLTRLMDSMKIKGITSFMTDLSNEFNTIKSEIGISSLTDTWIRLENQEYNNQLGRKINIIKSRGMKHSSYIKDFLITDKGIHIT